MARVPVFYSFHYDNDVFRVQQVRQMGVIDGDEPVSANAWEQVKRKGDAAVEKWIDDNMKWKRCVVVLVGSETAKRPWVKYEIRKAWSDGKALVGVRIHNLKCPRNGTCSPGPNPFDQFKVNGVAMSQYVRCHDPWSWDAYGSIKDNMSSWVNDAIISVAYRPK